MEIKVILILVIIILLNFVLFYTILPILSKKRAIKYIIKNRKDISINFNDNFYNIDNCKLLYYKDITIKKLDDGNYHIVFWGKRKTWRWHFKYDKIFLVKNSNNKLNKLFIKVIEDINNK